MILINGHVLGWTVFTVITVVLSLLIAVSKYRDDDNWLPFSIVLGGHITFTMVVSNIIYGWIGLE